MKTQRGFTLLEVLIGGGVLTAGMISLLFVSQALVQDLTPENTVGEMPPAAYPLLERYIDGCIEMFKGSPNAQPISSSPSNPSFCILQGATLSVTVTGGTAIIGSSPRLVRYQLDMYRQNTTDTGVTRVARVYFWRLETSSPGAYRGQ